LTEQTGELSKQIEKTIVVKRVVTPATPALPKMVIYVELDIFGKFLGIAQVDKENT